MTTISAEGATLPQTALGASDGTATGDLALDPALATTTTLSPAQVAISTMTVRQKAAQVLMFAFSGQSLRSVTADLVAAGPPGGLLILNYNFSGAAQLTALTAALQQAAAATGSPVGLFMAVDQEGGTVQRVKEGVPSVPSARKLGTESTPEEAADLARRTAHGLLALGVNMNLAPVADVVGDKKSFLFSRTYSGDPEVVSSYVAAVVQAAQGQGIILVVKHFPGHGSAPGDTHHNAAVSDATRQEFETVHLPPFRAAMAAGAEGVMMAHIVAKAYDETQPASISPAVVTGLLRDEIGYQGLVVTDDLSMAAVLDSVKSNSTQTELPGQDAKERRISAEALAVVAALNAGCDLLIVTEAEADSKALLDALVAAIEQGKVSGDRLDEAVLKILALKYRYGVVAQQAPATTTTEALKEKQP